MLSNFPRTFDSQHRVWDLAPSGTLLGETLTHEVFPLPELQGNCRESTLVEHLVCARHCMSSRYVMSSDFISTATCEPATPSALEGGLAYSQKETGLSGLHRKRLWVETFPCLPMGSS